MDPELGLEKPQQAAGDPFADLLGPLASGKKKPALSSGKLAWCIKQFGTLYKPVWSSLEHSKELLEAVLDRNTCFHHWSDLNPLRPRASVRACEIEIHFSVAHGVGEFGREAADFFKPLLFRLYLLLFCKQL